MSRLWQDCVQWTIKEEKTLWQDLDDNIYNVYGGDNIMTTLFTTSKAMTQLQQSCNLYIVNNTLTTFQKGQKLNPTMNIDTWLWVYSKNTHAT